MEIRFVGLREGEKLYEELQIGRDISSTNHSRIMVSNEYCETWESISKELSIVEKLIAIKKVQDAVARVSALSWLGS